MNRLGHENVSMFVGTEVEHTPAYGMRTLFVVGIQSHLDIHAMAMKHECDHIYFGANHSFPNISVNDVSRWQPWENMILFLLRSSRTENGPNYLCTLDVDVSCVEGVVEGQLCEYRNFIPMISVKVPYAKLLGYNTTIKIDDIDFDKTNPGVWCHSLHDLMDRSKFTTWDAYTKDEHAN